MVSGNSGPSTLHVYVVTYLDIYGFLPFKERMNTTELTGLNQGRDFNTRSGCTYEIHSLGSAAKLSNLELKTQHKQILGSFPG
jgi:hypothetical protein